MDALKRLKSTDPPQWLAPSTSLSGTAREACRFLFSTLKPHAPKSPFEELLVEGFDAEQIWQQIDLQSQPLLSGLRRQVTHFQKNPDEIGKLPKVSEGEKKVPEERGSKRFDEEDEDVDLGEFDEKDDDNDDDDDEEEEEDGKEEQEQEEEGKENEGIEDRFLKIKELEEYLEEDEAREYGLDDKKEKKKIKKGGVVKEDSEDEDESDEDEDGEEEEEEDEDEEDELGIFGDGGDQDNDDDGANKLENARYEDFFGGKKKKGFNKISKLSKEDSGSDDEGVDMVRKGGLSTHEKQLEKLRAEIEDMETANLEPKTWTMQGEVTASKRPMNSALEVDLDFEHNLRPPPVITEEVSASLEDMIKNRIIEGRFDDIQKVARLPPKAPKEDKEIDDNKSKKGLAEVYEDEYVQKTNPFAAPVSFSDEQKKEASMLFKQLCLKLDALSHFHFAPKPVIEDMSIQTNVPALAMEEIAPMAVSDAAMLAPEEVFAGKGDIKETAELTQADRKRRRAKKKRKFKAEEAKRVAKKARNSTVLNQNDNHQS